MRLLMAFPISGTDAATTELTNDPPFPTTIFFILLSGTSTSCSISRTVGLFSNLSLTAKAVGLASDGIRFHCKLRCFKVESTFSPFNADIYTTSWSNPVYLPRNSLAIATIVSASGNFTKSILLIISTAGKSVTAPSRAKTPPSTFPLPFSNELASAINNTTSASSSARHDAEITCRGTENVISFATTPGVSSSTS
ncbi:hypothetical protein AYI68_g5996 [Smittium mucronatum]|uniref:Uncharacterized protein n=1 Tax=Smittium mucronatum TaxID=133383 RepID=A0A1R0GSN6_9FUNG|nr:hypothetical protein AYI68_g5996 [Smittium mucronatum]